ncbi:FGGY family carbohydrate kinase [Pontibacter sp. E15-1]|uniref:FGGY family carbohydrate kinase n=1 Tax=Pontibacter sp. E15-1 TaxID=2919918 RepID=UPI001F4FC3DB|nr:FGGY family carbohydrate kinase [Pontibacter sp. E15-1]MCJ8166550.1 FGGY family carbohydrate kinase [Pontibacter sp. E15-1]
MIPCIAIFHIGKKSKRLLLFNQYYQVVKEEHACPAETVDEDGDKGEDLAALTHWLRTAWAALEADQGYDVLAVNFVTYGASMVHLNEDFAPVTPLYSYLKAYPQELEKQFYDTYGPKLQLAEQTASPPLGMLNAGLQLYWLKHLKPATFQRIRYSLHLPQYVAYVFTGQLTTEYTSLGCHTMLWDFQALDYHAWVYAEQLDKLFPALRQHYRPLQTNFRCKPIPAGLGLHDSSSALIPYLKQYRTGFLLLSAATWGITLNPFAKEPLSQDDLQQDCLQYLTFRGDKVKASRQFIQNAHEVQVNRLAAYYNKPLTYYQTVRYDAHLTEEAVLYAGYADARTPIPVKEKRALSTRFALDLALLSTYEEAYHRLLELIVQQQLNSLFVAAEGDLSGFRSLIVDGDFSRNELFMAMLRRKLPNLKVKSGRSAQDSALGAALALNIWPY